MSRKPFRRPRKRFSAARWQAVATVVAATAKPRAQARKEPRSTSHDGLDVGADVAARYADGDPSRRGRVRLIWRDRMHESSAVRHQFKAERPERCADEHVVPFDAVYACSLPAGHDGRHRARAKRGPGHQEWGPLPPPRKAPGPLTRLTLPAKPPVPPAVAAARADVEALREQWHRLTFHASQRPDGPYARRADVVRAYYAAAVRELDALQQ